MRSIRRQLTRQLVLGTLLIASCGGAVAYLTLRAAVIGQFDAALLGKARALCVLTEEKKGRVRLEADAARPLGFTADGTEHFFHLRLPNGKSIARAPAILTDELVRPENPGETAEFQNITLPGGIAGRAVAFTFTPRSDEDDDDDDDDEKRPKPGPVLAVITVASTREPLDATLHTMLAALGLSTGMLLVSGWVLVPRVLRRGLRPLDELAEQVTGITADSLATRVAESGAAAEIAPIARRLNDLLARLGAAFERERCFSAHLAHELRTPLAELRSQAELALKWPDARAASADADTLAIALRMEFLVTRLLAMARAEGGLISTTCERVTVEPLVQAVWRPFANLAAAKHLRVAFLIPPALAVESDPALLREILSNLLSNAANYTPEAGSIDLSATLTGNSFILTVTNTVDDLTPADLPEMFNRFWRKETARSDADHTGLGLALARSYASALGWSLHASLRDSSHLTISLENRKS